MSIRILGNKEWTSGIVSAIREKVLWPLYEFTIGVKGISIFQGNILTSLVLNLIALGIEDIEEIAETTCMNKDLILFLRDSLYQRGYIDDLGRVTEEGKSYTFENETQEDTISFFNFYLDGISGDLVPIVLPKMSTIYQNIYDANIGDDLVKRGKEDLEEERAGKALYFSINGTAGEEDSRPKKCHIFTNILDSAELSLPDQKDIRLLLCQKYPQLLEKSFSLLLPSAEQEDFLPSSKVFLMQELVVQKGDILNWQLTDGFGNISDFFSSRIKMLPSVDSRYFELKREKMNVEILSDLSYLDKEDNTELQKEWRQFPKIGEKIADFSLVKDALTVKVQTNDEKIDRNEKLEKALKIVYELLEYELWYLVRNDFWVNEAEKKCKDLGEYKIAYYIIKIAKNMGFHIDLSSKEIEREWMSFFRRKDTKIHAAITKKPELIALIDVLFVISLFDSNSIFSKLVLEKPGILIQLKELNKCRNETVHTAEYDVRIIECVKKAEALSNWIISNIYNKKINKILTIKKGYFELVEKQTTRNNTYAEFEKDFGIGFNTVLPGNLKYMLIEIERFSHKGIDEPEAIIPIYQAIECIFKHLMTSVSENFSFTENDYYNKALKIASENGFTFGENDCSYMKAKFLYVRKGMKGENASAQAVFLAWLLCGNKTQIKKIASEIPDLVGKINSVVRLRGHGEVPETGWDKGEILDDKNTVIKLVKLLSENGYLE